MTIRIRWWQCNGTGTGTGCSPGLGTTWSSCTMCEWCARSNPSGATRRRSHVSWGFKTWNFFYENWKHPKIWSASMASNPRGAVCERRRGRVHWLLAGEHGQGVGTAGTGTRHGQPLNFFLPETNFSFKIFFINRKNYFLKFNNNSGGLGSGMAPAGPHSGYRLQR